MSFKNKSVLVTGGAGFIGSALVARLVSEDARVTVIDSLVDGCGGNERNLTGLETSLKWIRDDLNRGALSADSLAGQEIVFHLAGHIGHQRSMEDPIFDLANNLGATATLLEACRKWSPRAKIIFSSTRQVYGTPNYLPVDEEHPVVPPDINGVHKVAAENYFRIYQQVHKLDTVVLRLTNTYGPKMSIRDQYQSAVGWFFNRAILNRKIEIFGNGEQRRDFNYVDDVVEAFILAASIPSLSGQVLNLSGEIASVASMAGKIISSTRSGSLDLIPFPQERKKIEIGDYFGSSQKFSKLTGWKPRVGLDDGLQRTADYFREYRSAYIHEGVS